MLTVRIDDYLATPRIESAEYYIVGDDEIRKESTIQVTNKDIFKGDRPELYGIYDAHMGSTDVKWDCRTCGNKKNVCPGHPGHLELHYPLKNPLFRDEILRWLKIVCHKCGRLLTRTTVTGAPEKLMNEYIRLCNPKKVKQCPWPDCGSVRFSIIKDRDRPFVFNVETRSENRVVQHEIYNHEIRHILDKVSDATVEKVLGEMRRGQHPRNLILEAIRVPPNTLRPDIRQAGANSARSSINDLTQFVRNIVDINDQLPKIIPPKEQFDKSLKAYYNLLELTYSEMVRGSTASSSVRLTTNTNKAPTSLSDRHKGKMGRIRGNLMGKRVFNAARSVITGDNYLQIDEVGIPKATARALQVPEIVNPTNYARLEKFFKNGLERYPGCTAIKKHNGPHMYSIQYLDKNYVLQMGDTVYRDLVDGDPVLMNRPPSLLFSNISGHRVKVMDSGLTFRINVSACKCYNADFDGDTMTLLTAQNIQSRVEIERMSWIGNWFISYQNHAPMFGAYMDALLGASLMTRSGVAFNKWHAMQCLGHVSPVGRRFRFGGARTPARTFSGREVISMFLPEVNFPDRKAKFYMPQYEGFIPYNPEETRVRVHRGTLTSGILDAASIGQGKIGSLFQVIKNEFGTKEALLAIYNFHQSIARFLMHQGVTVGIRDTFIGDETLGKIKQSIVENLSAAHRVIEQLSRNKLPIPYGQTAFDFFEEQQLKMLTGGDDFVKHIFQELDLQTNMLAWMIFIGSKGKINNFLAINAAIGSQTINGQRMLRNYGVGRTSPYFLRHDLDPRSLGYVENSFREGIAPASYPFAVTESRGGSINNQLSTPVSGAQNRQNVKNMETMILSNSLMAAKKQKITQLLYGESGFDPRKTEIVKFISVELGDSEFEAQFRLTTSRLPKKFRTPVVERLLEEEFAQLASDRAFFRRTFLRVEANNQGSSLFSRELQLPVNPFFVIESFLQDNEELLESFSPADREFNPVDAVAMVRELCDTLGYVYMNKHRKAAQIPVPAYMERALDLTRIALRMYFCTAYLHRKNVCVGLLRLMVEKVLFTMKNALMQPGIPIGIIAAQCLSEPLTQYALDSKHRSGGGGGSRTSTADRIKEILGARDTKSMKNPGMIIMLKPEFEQDRAFAQTVGNHIEVMDLQRFVSRVQIFYEEFGKPVHPQYAAESRMIAAFEKVNVGLRRPALSKWCFRFELDKEELLINSMQLESIVMRLRLVFPKSYLVYTPETADQLVVRMYLGSGMLKSSMGYDVKALRVLLDKVMKTVIRGVEGILQCNVFEMPQTYVDQESGAIATRQIFAIQTVGSNLEEVLDNPYVDPMRTQTDSIKEFEAMYGVDACRNKIIMELARVLKSDDVVRMHSSLFADEMTFSGTITSILKNGLSIRERNNVSLRISFQAPNVVIKDAAIDAIREKDIGGISGPFLFGQVPKLGTTYNDILINRAFVEAQQKRLHTHLEELL